MQRLDEAELSADDPLKPLSVRPRLRFRLALSAMLVGSLVLLLLVQGFDPSSPTRRFLALLLTDVRDPRWGVLYVLLAFSAAAVAFAPITVMFLATSLALDPLHGFVYCLLGGIWGASLAYVTGRALGARPLARYRGAHLARLERELHKRPLRSVLIARFLPIGNFTLINLLLGSLRVPYSAFALGSLAGMLPGVLGLTLCKGLLERVLYAPSLANISLLAAAFIAITAALYVIARTVARRRRALLSADATHLRETRMGVGPPE